MEECRILFLNAAARRKKQENQLRCFPFSGFNVVRPIQRNSAEVIDIEEARAATKPRQGD